MAVWHLRQDDLAFLIRASSAEHDTDLNMPTCKPPPELDSHLAVNRGVYLLTSASITYGWEAHNA